MLVVPSLQYFSQPNQMNNEVRNNLDHVYQLIKNASYPMLSNQILNTMSNTNKSHYLTLRCLATV